jgi:hypothetical protein
LPDKPPPTCIDDGGIKPIFRPDGAAYPLLLRISGG